MTIHVVDGKIGEGMSIKNTIKGLNQKTIDNLIEHGMAIDKDYFYKRIKDIYLDGLP